MESRKEEQQGIGERLAYRFSTQEKDWQKQSSVLPVLWLPTTRFDRTTVVTISPRRRLTCNVDH